MKLLFIEFFLPGSLVLGLESKRLPSHNKAWNTSRTIRPGIRVPVAPCLFALCMKLNLFPRKIELSDFRFVLLMFFGPYTTSGIFLRRRHLIGVCFPLNF